MQAWNGTAGRALTRRSFVKGGAAAAAGLALGAPRLAAARRGAAADLVLRNGRVHTLAGARQQAVAIADGRIAYVGSNAGADALAGAGDRGHRPRSADRDARDPRRPQPPVLRRCRADRADPQLRDPRPEAVRQADPQAPRQARRKRARRLDGGRSSGTRPRWTSCRPRRTSTSSRRRRPIIVYSLDGHIALANSRALAIAGIDATTDPPGGEIRRGPRRRADRDPARQRDRPRRRRRSRRSQPNRTPTRSPPATDDGRGRDHHLPARVRARARAHRPGHCSPTAAASGAPAVALYGRGRARPPTRRRCSARAEGLRSTYARPGVRSTT